MATPQEVEDVEVRENLKRLAKLLDKGLPYGWGFIFMVFPFGEGGRMNYISNADRPDVVRSMYEFIEATRGQWGEHEAPLGAAAEDEQLARARQRVAELEREREQMVGFCGRERERLQKLERELEKALEGRHEWMEKATVDRQRIAKLEKTLNLINLKDLEYLMELAAAHMVGASPFNAQWYERAKAYQALFHERIVELEEQ